jgi:hypothetical protein
MMATVSDAIVLNQELVQIRRVVDPNNDDGKGHPYRRIPTDMTLNQQRFADLFDVSRYAPTL